MINNDFRTYDYYLYTVDNTDAYGQPILIPEPIGTVKMAIYITSQSIQDNINYSGAQYLGLTYDNLSDRNVIQYDENTKLKVLYVNPQGRLKQVFLAEI